MCFNQVPRRVGGYLSCTVALSIFVSGQSECQNAIRELVEIVIYLFMADCLLLKVGKGFDLLSVQCL